MWSIDIMGAWLESFRFNMSTQVSFFIEVLQQMCALLEYYINTK